AVMRAATTARPSSRPPFCRLISTSVPPGRSRSKGNGKVLEQPLDFPGTDNAAARALLQALEQVWPRHLPVLGVVGKLRVHRDQRLQPRAGHLLQALLAEGGVVTAVMAHLVEHRPGEQVLHGDLL